MSAFIIRRWWLIRNRFFSFIALAFIVPSILSIVTVFGTKNIVVRSINGQPYEIWVLPGLMMFLAAVLITPLIYRDFFHLRIHSKALISMTLAPIRKSSIILGILVSALLKCYLSFQLVWGYTVLFFLILSCYIVPGIFYCIRSYSRFFTEILSLCFHYLQNVFLCLCQRC